LSSARYSPVVVEACSMFREEINPPNREKLKDKPTKIRESFLNFMKLV